MGESTTRPHIECRAQKIADTLITRISFRNGEWDPVMWGSVFAAVQLVSDDMREAAPYAILLYQRYVRIAALFLSKFPDKGRRQRFVACVRGDMASLAYHRIYMKANAFTEEEHQLVSDAVEDLYNVLEVIDR